MIRVCVGVLFLVSANGCASKVTEHQSTTQLSPNVAHIVTLDGPSKAGSMLVEVVSTDAAVTVRVYREKEAAEVDKQMAGEAKPIAEQVGAKEISLRFDAPAKEKLRIVIAATQATTVTVKAKAGS